MKIKYKPEIYHVDLHSNTDKEPMASVACFSFVFVFVFFPGDSNHSTH